jgi:hypothetical protein
MKRLSGATLLLLLSPFVALAAQERLPFSDGRWEFRGDSTVVDTLDGRESLRLVSGFAYRRDVRLQDGTIDLEVMLTRKRSFVYVSFRMASDREYEEFYLRPHKSGLPDAVQYAPVWQGQSAWQLYHGPEGTAAPELPLNAWTQLRIVVSGDRAALFVGDTLQPVLVSRLAHPSRPGYLSLGSFLPAGSKVTGPVARFSRVRVRPGVVAWDFPEAPPPVSPPGVIGRWILGAPFAPPDSGISSLGLLPPPALAPGRTVAADARGLVALHALVQLPAQGRSAAGVVAAITVHADAGGSRRLDLGFSDIATVFVNGQPLARLDASYSYQGRREGVISFDQATLFLPLKRGPNEVRIVVTDSFGGWGLMGRFPDMRGLRITP